MKKISFVYLTRDKHGRYYNLWRANEDDDKKMPRYSQRTKEWEPTDDTEIISDCVAHDDVRFFTGIGNHEWSGGKRSIRKICVTTQ